MAGRLLAALALAALLAALAHAAQVNATPASATQFHLWLKCKAIELYVSVTGTNFTLPQCETLLAQANKTFIVTRRGAAPVPMVGVGELKLLNVSDPRAVFEQLRAIRMAALKELRAHANRTLAAAYARAYGGLNITRCGANCTLAALNATERALGVLHRVRELLRRVNANEEAVSTIERGIRALNGTRHVLRWRPHFENATYSNITQLAEEVRRLRELARELREYFKRVGAREASQILSIREALLNETQEALEEIKRAYEACMEGRDASAIAAALRRAIAALESARDVLQRVNASSAALRAVEMAVDRLKHAADILAARVELRENMTAGELSRLAEELRKLGEQAKKLHERIEALGLRAASRLLDDRSGALLNASAALSELSRTYEAYNKSGEASEILRATERGVRALEGLERLLQRLDASDMTARVIREHLEGLRALHKALTLNVTDVALRGAINEIEGLMQRLQRLLERFESVKLAALRALKELSVWRDALKQLIQLPPDERIARLHELLKQQGGGRGGHHEPPRGPSPPSGAPPGGPPRGPRGRE
jgi:tetratricopeptide (TPR) repeat protein